MSQRRTEEGSTAFVAMACLASVALAIAMAGQSAKRLKAMVTVSKMENAHLQADVGSTNALSHYKSLVSPKKIGSAWKPVIYAANYFDKNWKIRTLPLDEKVKQVNPRVTSIKLREAEQNESDVTRMMSSGGSPRLGDYKVRFLKANFGASNQLVTSIDVEVIGRTDLASGTSTTMNVAARLPLPPPQPYDPKLFFRKPAGSWTEMKDDADLTEGPYEFIARVSGIAFDGDLLVDGAPITKKATFGGRDASGKVRHDAVNFLNIDGEMGPAFLYDPTPKAEPDEASKATKEGSAEAVVNDGNYSKDGTSCGFVKGSYASGDSSSAGKAGSVESTSSALSLTKTFQLVIRSADGGVSETNKTKVFKARIRKPQMLSDTGGRKLTADDYRNLCQAECPYIGDNPTGAEIGGYSGFVGSGPISAMRTLIEAQERWGIFTKKICFKFPGAPKPGYDQHDSEVWAYDPNTCKGEKLFRRGACGCLTGDTRIMLGDGKTEKRIDEMNAWDRAWNPILRKSFAVRRYTVGPENKPLVQLELGEIRLQATRDHPFLTQRGLLQASRLTSEDFVKLGEDQWQKLSKVSNVPVPENPPIVWNLELEGDDDDLDSHYVLANGVVTGDLLIQKKLKSEDNQE